MKHKYLLLYLLLISGLFANTLSLQESINKTLAHHPDVKTFMLRIQQAEQGYNAAYADYLPQLDVSATYSPRTTYALPQNGIFHTIDDTGWNAGVTLHQKVWDFSKTSSLVQATKTDEAISRLSLKEVKALLAYKVRSLYALLVVQQEAIFVRKKDLEAKKAFYAQSKALVKQGLKTHADANRFLSSVYVAEDNLAIAKAAFEKARTSLSLYMGTTLTKNVKLHSSALKKKQYPRKRVEDEILAHNYKIRMDRLSSEKNKLIHKSTQAAQYGSINLVATHNRVDTLNSYNSDYVGLSYTVPLYTGGKLSAQEQQAKIGYQISKEQEASHILTLKEELHGILVDIKRYRQSIKAKKAQLHAAQSTQKELNARYKEGLATYIEVLDSIALTLDAKLGLLEAYYLKSVALYRIDYLKGKI
ncbi:TolC family protein [Sulfurovum sp.]|uniref:TolC family protein n=1 Tax=Sulfurovum sp. TaxID=1969726 RepID=UPI0025F37532|nr:TolC family protein [Sulfurovum sp.]